MPQRVVFPALPNIADAHYLGILQSIFGEIGRSGGRVPFKTFREWAKERNLYNKDEFDELMALLGCEVKPEVVLGEFGRKFAEATTPEAQQRLLYRWLWGWNPILVKAVFEQLDTDSGGRLHSTHELYRYITSYAYPGAYVTLINFQNWVKWMAATGHIRYIGIRWGLGELGKKELPPLRNFDVDEFLEDESSEGEAPAQPTLAQPTAVASSSATSRPSDPDADEELPDMPPEAAPPPPEPVAQEITKGPPSAPAAPSAPVAAPPAGATPRPQAVTVAAPVAGGAVWIPSAPTNEPLTARELGFDATQYGEHPAAFLMGLALAARLATSGVPAAAVKVFVEWLLQDRVPHRLLVDARPLDELLEAAGWLRDRPVHAAVFGYAAIDVLRLRRVLATHPALPTRLEESRPADALMVAHDKLFGGAVTGAAFWLHREMVDLELWDAG